MFMPDSRILEWFNIYVLRKAADPPKSESEQWKEYRRIRNYTQNYQINNNRTYCFFRWPRNSFHYFYERRVFSWLRMEQCDSDKEAKSKRNTFTMCCNFCNYYLKLAAFYLLAMLHSSNTSLRAVRNTWTFGGANTFRAYSWSLSLHQPHWTNIKYKIVSQLGLLYCVFYFTFSFTNSGQCQTCEVVHIVRRWNTRQAVTLLCSAFYTHKLRSSWMVCGYRVYRFVKINCNLKEKEKK